MRILFTAALAMAVIACGTQKTETPDDTQNAGDVVEVRGAITTDTTWTAGNTYRLAEHVFVKDGAVLTIEPGTTILGDKGSSLAITRTGRIEAVGTAEAPIVFTSSAPVGERRPSDWGGVVLLGSAPINVQGGVENIEGYVESDDTAYGGADLGHNCGSMKYVRIEFAGFALATDKELNGLTVGACGSATELDFIQVHKGSDDGVEFFGGTAGIRHLVITQPEDDGLDWDYGWTGSVQFLVIQQNGANGDNGFEADNNGNANDATPRSKPVIYNATLIGSGLEPSAAGTAEGAMLLRRGTAGEMHNLVVAHFKTFSADVDGSASVKMANEGQLFVKNSLFWMNGGMTDGTWPADRPGKDKEGNPLPDNDSGFDETAFFGQPDFHNVFVDPMLEAPLNLEAPNMMPKAGSPVLNPDSAATPPAGFDTSARFLGALGTTDWTAGWTAYPAN